MWFFKRGKHRLQTQQQPAVVDITLKQVKEAIRFFESHLPKGVNRTVLLRQGNEIQFELLVPYLGGLPSKKFYMSRETFEVFGEEDRDIPYYLDMVQRAVDDYIEDYNQNPVVTYDRSGKISYQLLMNGAYLKEKPPMCFYLTEDENLITHKEPKREGLHYPMM